MLALSATHVPSAGGIADPSGGNVCPDRGFVLASTGRRLYLVLRYLGSYAPLAGLVVILCACTSNTGTQLPQADFYVSTGQQFGLRVGETAGISTSSAIVLVRFDGVGADSRCPVDVECVTAGSATSQLTVQTALSLHQIALDVPPTGTVDQQVDEITLTAIGLRPDAQSGVTINPIDYVIGLSVTETGSLPVP